MSAQTMSRKDKIQWLFVVLAPVMICLIPTDEQFTPEIRTFLAITAVAILLFAFELLHQLLPALLLPFAYYIFGLADLSVVFSPWAQPIPWVVIGGFLLANIMERTGLLKRIAYWCIVKTGGTYTGIIMGLILAHIIVNLLKPGGIVVASAALAYGICKALNLGKSKASAGIMMATAVGSMTTGHFVFTPSNIGVLFGAVSEVAEVPITFFDYFLENIVFLPLPFLIGLMIAKMMKPDEPIGRGKAFFIEQQKSLGPMTLDEKKTALVLVSLFVYLMTTNLHGLDMVLGFIILPTVLYLPGINVGTPADAQKINFSFVVFIAACMSIGSVAVGLGVGQLISSLALPYLGGVGPFGLISFVYLLAIILNLLLTPLAAMGAFGAPLVQLAMDLGISPYPVMYTFFQGLDQVILPYEYALYLIFYSFGLIYVKDFMKIMGAKMLVSFIYTCSIGVLWWMFMGLL